MSDETNGSGAGERVLAWLCRYDGSVHRRGIHHPGDTPLVPATPDADDALWLALRQTLVAEWRDDYSVVSIVDALTATAERIVAARESAAASRARAEERERIARVLTRSRFYDDRDAEVAARIAREPHRLGVDSQRWGSGDA